MEIKNLCLDHFNFFSLPHLSDYYLANQTNMTTTK